MYNDRLLFSFSMGRSFWNPNFTYSPNIPYALLLCLLLSFFDIHLLLRFERRRTHTDVFTFYVGRSIFFTFSFKWWKKWKEMICNQTRGLVLRFRAPYENVGTPCITSNGGDGSIFKFQAIRIAGLKDPNRSCSKTVYDMDKKVLDKKPTWHVAPHHRRCTGSWISLVSHCSESRKAKFF